MNENFSIKLYGFNVENLSQTKIEFYRGEELISGEDLTDEEIKIAAKVISALMIGIDLSN